MDSSYLTEFRRNRIASNSHNNQKLTKPYNKITQMSSDLIINLLMGSKEVVYNNTTILPKCGGPACNQDNIE